MKTDPPHTPPPKRSRGRPKSPFTEPQGTIQALERGLVVLRTVASADALTLSEVSERLDIPVATAHRILATLEKMRFVRLDQASQRWSVGVEAFRTGTSFLRQTNLLEIGRTAMRRLMEDTGETANMAVRDGGEVVFIGQVETHAPIRAFFRPGTRGALHASGIGKALLSAMPQGEADALLSRAGLRDFTPHTRTNLADLRRDLAESRARGWAVDDEERYLGMRCVAAPIFDSSEQAVAGISVSGPTVRLDRAALQAIGPRVREAAREVEEGLGGRGPKDT
ncbi:MAG: IclR family transcriptional regulator [Rhodobacteraceae bacterium]|nr:IclR family transcriptional regulator [Paracoccaceae bacterium]